MKKGKGIAVWLALLILTGFCLAACGNGIPMVSDAGDGQGYSDAQIMLVVATERNRYRDVYTDQIWQVEVDDEGTLFQTYLLKSIQSFLQELRTMNRLADERGIKLTGQEKEQLEQLAEDFYGSLTEEDRKYTGIDEEGVYDFYVEYHLANKLVDELTRDVNLEISDSEAKVIRVQEIVLSDESQAQEVYGQATAENGDFLSLARSVSEEKEIEKPIGRNERSKEYEDVVFSLEAGGISPVIRDEGKFYIVRCVDDYDEDATLERKKKLAAVRKNQAFRQIYDSFVSESSVEIKSDVWAEISLAEDSASTTTGLFERYQEMMNP